MIYYTVKIYMYLINVGVRLGSYSGLVRAVSTGCCACRQGAERASDPAQDKAALASTAAGGYAACSDVGGPCCLPAVARRRPVILPCLHAKMLLV